MRKLFAVAFAAFLAHPSANAQAQSYPTKPIRFVLPFGPGSASDTLARIAVKNHKNGTRNPKAHFQKEITMEQALNAPFIAWPLGLYDCCANIDGGACAILASPELFPPDEALAVAQPGGRLLASGEQRVRIEALDLEPVD